MKYPENSIVILNKESLTIKHTEFKKDTNYRASFDEDQKGCLVYGEWMTRQKFEANFVFYIPLLQARLKQMGLIVKGKPVSYKEFKERAYIVGRGYINIHIYIHPKDGMFSFYPAGTRTKTEGLKQCYDMYVNLVTNTDTFLYSVDGGYIRWSNGGLPLGGGYPRRDELSDEIFKEYIRK